MGCDDDMFDEARARVVARRRPTSSALARHPFAVDRDRYSGASIDEWGTDMPKSAGTAAPGNPTGAKRDEFEDFERDQWKRPRIPAPGTSGRKDLPKAGYTRSSTLGSTLEDQFNLGEWKMGQAVFGLSRSKAQYLAAQAVERPDGTVHKRQLRDIGLKCLDIAESGGFATIGTAIHALSERVDRGDKIPHIEGEARDALDAWVSITAGFGKIATEAKVVCHLHKVAGTFDRLFVTLGPMVTPDGERLPAGTILLADLKTSGTSDYFGLKFAVQLAEYAHGEPFDLESYGVKPWEWLTGGVVDIARGDARPHPKWALIVHVPTGNPKGSGLYWVDIESGARLSELAITVREQRNRRDLVVPAQAPTIPTVLSAAGLHAAILGTRDKPSLDALWRSHRGVWDQSHTERATSHLAKLAQLARAGA